MQNANKDWFLLQTAVFRCRLHRTPNVYEVTVRSLATMKDFLAYNSQCLRLLWKIRLLNNFLCRLYAQ